MKLYNTLTRSLEEFTPIKKGVVSMYNCGPTVYMHMHVGNLRAYAFVDVLRRTFEYLGYEVDQVMNLTDVGHLTSDADTGEDKMEKSASREGKDIWEIAETYIKSVKSDFIEMNYLTPKKWIRATDYIQEMIEMNKKIVENGFAYETDRALYYDVTKYDDYTRLQGGQKLKEKRVGVRDAVNVDSNKKHPADFALWVKCVGPYENHIMRWDSPWGVGFPGWHIECSAMSINNLSTHFDIHTGGEDHISVHHPNERAQNYGVCQKELVNMWVHNMFLLVDGGKMGKSLGNVYELSDIKKKGFDPLDLRFFFLSAKFRTRQNFTWENLRAARTGRQRLLETVSGLQSSVDGKKKGHVVDALKEEYQGALGSNLNTPEALAVVWKLLKDSDISVEDRLATVYDFDRVLGLGLEEAARSKDKVTDKLKQEIEQLVKKREEARKSGDWEVADDLRPRLLKLGVTVEDTERGPKWSIRKALATSSQELSS